MIDRAGGEGFRPGRSELFSPREAQQLWTVMMKAALPLPDRPSPRPRQSFMQPRPAARARAARPFFKYVCQEVNQAALTRCALG